MWPFMFLTYVRPWDHFFSPYFAAFVSFMPFRHGPQTSGKIITKTS